MTTDSGNEGGMHLDLNDPFDVMLIKMKKMHDAKGHDYGDEDEYANIRASEELGISPWVGVAMRMNDKMQRLKKFARVGALKVKNESVLDTFIDLAVYAIIGHIMFEQERKLPSNHKDHIHYSEGGDIDPNFRLPSYERRDHHEGGIVGPPPGGGL